MSDRGRLILWVATSITISCGPAPEPQYSASSPMCAGVEYAQQAGYRDGASGQASQAGWFMSTCPPQTRDMLASSYHDAHARGWAEYQAGLARNAEAARQAEGEHLRRLCTDASTAFQAGYNAGYRREAMSADWADRYCAPADSARTKERYIAGFQAGMSQAPQPVAPPPVQPVIVVSGRNGRVAAASTQDSCRFSSDCGEGNSCRHVSELGHSVCMGDGVRGDYCWFDSDCLSDSCRLQSGGTKTCK